MVTNMKPCAIRSHLHLTTYHNMKTTCQGAQHAPCLHKGHMFTDYPQIPLVKKGSCPHMKRLFIDLQEAYLSIYLDLSISQSFKHSIHDISCELQSMYYGHTQSTFFPQYMIGFQIVYRHHTFMPHFLSYWYVVILSMVMFLLHSNLDCHIPHNLQDLSHLVDFIISRIVAICKHMHKKIQSCGSVP